MSREANRLIVIALPVVLLSGIAVWLAGQGTFGPRFVAASPTPSVSSPGPATPRGSTRPAALVAPDSPVISAPSAKVTLVEFLDFECEACGAAYPTVKRILADYKGRLTYVVRDFPNHNNSTLAASAAYAANEQAKYWEMYDLLFQRQQSWAERQNSQFNTFLGFGEELGLDMTRFRADLESGRYLERLQRDRGDAGAFGVDATPTFFINGTRYVGVMPYEEMARLIDGAIAAPGS